MPDYKRIGYYDSLMARGIINGFGQGQAGIVKPESELRLRRASIHRRQAMTRIIKIPMIGYELQLWSAERQKYYAIGTFSTYGAAQSGARKIEEAGSV